MAFGASILGLGAVSGPQVGDFVEGGVVFWVDGSGGGMVASINNSYRQFSSCRYGTVTTSLGFGAGAANTAALYANSCGTAGATISSDATTSSENGYTDWFAPSRSELVTAWQAVGPLSPLGNLANFYTPNNIQYWSSSTSGGSPYLAGWYVVFGSTGNIQYNSTDQRDYYNFKKIRAF